VSCRNGIVLVVVAFALFDTRCGDLSEPTHFENQTSTTYEPGLVDTVEETVSISPSILGEPNSTDLGLEEGFECLELCNRFMECAFIPATIGVLQVCIRDCQGHPHSPVNLDLDRTCDELRSALREVRVSS